MSQVANTHYRFVHHLYTVFLVLCWIVLITGQQGSEVVFINGLHTHYLDIFFAGITNLGNGIIFLPFVITLLFNRFYLAMALVMDAASHGIVVSVFKRILFAHAGRPITLLNNEILYFVPEVEVHTAMSFPSGHTATIFGLMVFLSLYIKNKFATVLFLIIATSVGISRIYLLQHFGLDVVAGAFIGTFTAIISYHAFERLEKPEWMLQRFQFKSGGMKIPNNNSVSR